MEPGSVPWQDTVLQLDHWCLLLTLVTFIFAGVVKGHEGKFSIYIHTFKERPIHISPHFYDREIHSDENQHFVLLSERY